MSITVVIHLLLSSLYVAAVNECECVWVSGRTKDGSWSNLVVDNRAQTNPTPHDVQSPGAIQPWNSTFCRDDSLTDAQQQKNPKSCRIILFIHYIPVNTHVSLDHVSCLQVYNLLKYVFPRSQSASSPEIQPAEAYVLFFFSSLTAVQKFTET